MWKQWPFFQKNWTKGHWLLDDLWPHVCWGHLCHSTQGSLCPSPMGIHQCMWIQWSILQNTTLLRLYILRTYILRTVTLLFETSEICFGSTKMEISTRKKSILCREKSGKVTLPLLKDISLMPLITNDNSLHVLFLFFPTSIISFLQTDDIKQQVYN